MKILLAEDDKNLGKMLTLLLRKQNIVVDWLENGRAAYEKIYSDGYDVIVLDWMMPGLNGLELCRRLREEEYDGKILILTARDAVEDRVNGLNSGADDYLVKPFDITELTARLHALFAAADSTAAKSWPLRATRWSAAATTWSTPRSARSCARGNSSCWSC